MTFPFLLLADLHFTSNPIDAYRWGIFKWLQSTVRKYEVKSIFILGDLTEAKDFHSAELVNRLVKGLTEISKDVENIYILKANHDYKKANHPFFEFLGHIPKLHFITKPTVLPTFNALMLPHTKTPTEDWNSYDFSCVDYVFMHQTVNKAVTSNRQALSSSLSAKFNVGEGTKIYSGDIHVPQVIGDVEYVGSPYPVHFGDDFEGRAILIRGTGKATDLHCPTIKRASVTIRDASDLDALSLKKGDQIKIKLLLPVSAKHEWEEKKRWIVGVCETLGVELCSLELKIDKEEHRNSRTRLKESGSSHISATEIISSYVEQESLGGELLDMALDIMES